MKISFRRNILIFYIEMARTFIWNDKIIVFHKFRGSQTIQNFQPFTFLILLLETWTFSQKNSLWDRTSSKMAECTHKIFINTNSYHVRILKRLLTKLITSHFLRNLRTNSNWAITFHYIICEPYFNFSNYTKNIYQFELLICFRFIILQLVKL